MQKRMMLNNILQLKKGKREKAKKKGRELLTLQCSANCAVKTKTSGQASLLSSSLPMAGAEHRMKINNINTQQKVKEQISK